MPQVPLNKPAPDFTLKSFTGEPVTLSSYRSQKNVLLVFNRGFT
jgi:peroxiredoxin